MADALQTTVRTIERETKWAGLEGIVQDIRDKMLAPLDKVPGVYDAAMSAPVEDLTKNAKGWKIRLDAARDISTGMGAFKNESVKHNHNTVSLETIAAERAATPVPPSPNRIAFRPEDTVDGELLSPEDPDYRDIPDSPTVTALLAARQDAKE